MVYMCFLSSSLTFVYHTNRCAVATVTFVPVARTVTSDYTRWTDNYVIRPMVTYYVIIAVVKSLNTVVSDKPLGFLQHLVMNVITAHSVQNPIYELIIFFE